ncbi:MAG: tetratricopeptide repeat protein [Candidatus Thorarchaeota archaeon]
MTFLTKTEPADEEFLSEVDKLLSANDDKLNHAALDLLLRETVLHPFIAEYWDWLSRCYLCIGERDAAKEAFRKFMVLSLGKISFAPSNDVLLLEYPRMIEELGGVNDAESIYMRVLSQQPRNLQLIRALSDFYRRHEAFDKSLNVLENGLSNTHDISLQVEIIRVLGRLDRWKEALQYAERAMKKEKKNSLLHEAAGLIHLSTEEYRKAEIQFKRAVNLDPSNARHWQYYGISLFNQKKLHKAEEAFLKSVECDESLYEGWNTLGIIYRELEKFSEAEKTFQFIIEKWPNNASVYSNLGGLYIDSGMSHRSKDCFLKAEKIVLRDCDELLKEKRYSECMDNCTRAARYNPKSSLACAYSAIILIEMEFYDKALDFVEKAITLDPECSEAWTAKAYFELANRRFGRAERFAIKAVDLKPDSGQALEVLAMIQNEVQKYSEAEHNIRLYLKQKPTSHVGMLHLARSLHEQGRVSESIDVLMEALLSNPWSAMLWYSISIVLTKHGQEQDAAVALQRAKELHPEIDEKVTAFRERFIH